MIGRKKKNWSALVGELFKTIKQKSTLYSQDCGNLLFDWNRASHWKHRAPCVDGRVNRCCIASGEKRNFHAQVSPRSCSLIRQTPPPRMSCHYFTLQLQFQVLPLISLAAGSVLGYCKLVISRKLCSPALEKDAICTIAVTMQSLAILLSAILFSIDNNIWYCGCISKRYSSWSQHSSSSYTNLTALQIYWTLFIRWVDSVSALFIALALLVYGGRTIWRNPWWTKDFWMPSALSLEVPALNLSASRFVSL